MTFGETRARIPTTGAERKQRRRSGSEPLVAVVQATDLGRFDNLAPGRRGHGSRLRRVLAQRKMRSCPVVVGEVSSQNPPKMPLAEDDDVIEAFSSHGTDQALRVWILPFFVPISMKV
jgi:hypothetical protein